MNLIYRDITRYKYQVAQNYQHQTDILGFDIETKFLSLNPAGLLTIREGYLSDGSSGPTIDTEASMRGPFVHDALYELMRRSLLPIEYRPYADKLFREILLEDGVLPARAKVWYDMVRVMASGCAEPGTELDRTFCAGKE